MDSAWKIKTTLTNWHQTEDNLTKAQNQKMTSNKWPTTNTMKEDNNLQLLLFTKDNQNFWHTRTFGHFEKSLDISEKNRTFWQILDNFGKFWTPWQNFDIFEILTFWKFFLDILKDCSNFEKFHIWNPTTNKQNDRLTDLTNRSLDD